MYPFINPDVWKQNDFSYYTRRVSRKKESIVENDIYKDERDPPSVSPEFFFFFFPQDEIDTCILGIIAALRNQSFD